MEMIPVFRPSYGEEEVEAVRHVLASGWVGLGPVTRTGCGETCIRVNMPCRGCFGPPDGTTDPAASFLSALASTFVWETAEDLAKLIEAIPDPAGTFYRYGLPKSLLGRRFDEGGAR